jgi:hypothetical protein
MEEQVEAPNFLVALVVEGALTHQAEKGAAAAATLAVAAVRVGVLVAEEVH